MSAPDPRRSPEALLERIRHEDEASRRARLKIFFGASAGVGKTYAMLVEAHEQKTRGKGVVVGLVETHGRAETAALVDGLELLPRKQVAHRGVTVPEFDLDAALARKPQLLLLDELAHTNAPGSRHKRRFQDVLELLDAGIDVATTLNVQHVESLNDVVSRVTGIVVRETVPDSLLDRADEIEFVDLPPDDLLTRLREGKVYLPDQAQRAIEHFFQKGNLIALRELALRQAALRVDAQMERYRRTQGIGEPWAVHGRILVAIGDAAPGLKLVRAARALAAEARAEWIVAWVETPAALRASDSARAAILDVLGLAEDLGGETVILSGLRVSDELIAYARSRNVARIVVGKPTRPRWMETVFGSLVSTLVRDSGPIDIHVLRADEEGGQPPPQVAAPRTGARAYVGMLAVMSITSALAWACHHFLDPSNLVMVFLLGVLVSAASFGRGPGVVASLLAVGIFDFFFVPPYYTLAVSDTQYLVTFVVMLLTALTVNTLASRMRQQTASARERESRTAALYRLARELAGPAVLDAAAATVASVMDGPVAILLPGSDGRLEAAAGDRTLFGAEAHELGVAQWVFDRGQPAGLGTTTLPAARALYLPLEGAAGTCGVLAVCPPDARRLQDPRQFALLEAIASQVALALERGQLAADAARSRLAAEAEGMRSALLSSVSHDLRTPLAAIHGAATSLRDDDTLAADVRRELAATIAEESERLNRLVTNLLDMTRLESGTVELRRGWSSLEELVGSALGRLEPVLAGRPVVADVPNDLPLVALDDTLVEQALFNLLENAVKYSPAGSPIEIHVRSSFEAIRIEVADRGAGVNEGDEERVFEKFARGSGDTTGSGLGLAIVRGIAHAHGGDVRAERRPGGGSVFTLVLPRVGEAPPAPAHEAAPA
jgi:two-component system sensor histidine kinase KdpD